MSRADAPPEPVNCSVSDTFHAWMSQCGGSLVVTTYQAGRVALIGFDGQRVSPALREFPSPMGVAALRNLLVLASGSEITLFANAAGLAPHYPPSQPAAAGYDALYLPRVTHHTGDLRVHDIGFGGDGIWFVNTLFSCLCTLGSEYNFEPRWRPPFVSALAAEDRCHLNGMAIVEGMPRYVTALGATDAAAGWRADKASGGVLIDVPSGQNILTGLSMPHSPRWYDGKLWMLNSGTGELCLVEPQQGRYMPVCVLPGFLRGLCFVGPFALVGLSQIRQSNVFGGLRVKEQFEKLLCGVAVIDLRTGQQVAMFEFTSGIHELFEIQFLPGVRRPMMLRADSDEAQRAIVTRGMAAWYKPETKT